MNNFDETTISPQQARSTLIPRILMVVFVLANILLGVIVAVPQWRTRNDLMAQIDTGQESLDIMNQNPDDAQQPLQQEMGSWLARRDNTALTFLSDSETDSILEKLYQYATASDVEIIDLQLQPPLQDSASQPYEVQSFHLQVAGQIPQLAGFMVLFREGSIPSVVLKEVNIGEGETQTILTMTILLYTTPYAPGDVLANLPAETILPTPIPTTTLPTRVPGTISPSPSPSPMPTIAETVAVTPQPTMTETPVAFESVVGVGTYDDTHPAFRYTTGVWESIDSYSGFGGSYHYSADTNAELEFSFVGTDVAIQYVAFRNFGIFEVYVDGIPWHEVDGYASQGTFGQVVYIHGLTQNAHTITIRNTPQRNDASQGNVLAVDVIQVLESTSSSITP